MEVLRFRRSPACFTDKASAQRDVDLSPILVGYLGMQVIYWAIDKTLYLTEVGIA